MKLKRNIVLLVVILCPLIFFGQIKVSKTIQPSKIAKSDENALYFIDFWATWCGPCIHASKYLESLQKQFPNKFYIVSLSQESPEVINRFMEKHETGLAVAIDYQGETFTKHNVKSLPYGVLYNAMGFKLWEGHAADLKNYHIKEYLRNNKTTSSLNSFFEIHKYKEAVVEKTAEIKKDFMYIENSEIEMESSQIQIIEKSNFLELRGSLKDILSYSLKSCNKQIEIPQKLNKYYAMRFKKGSKEYENKEKYILKALRLKKDKEEVQGDFLVLNIEEPNFWNTKQIDWGENNASYLIGDSEIQADNVPLNEVTYKLANLLETPVIIINDQVSEVLHDWQIHYKYFELMSANLSDYGIKVEKKKGFYPQYCYRAK